MKNMPSMPSPVVASSDDAAHGSSPFTDGAEKSAPEVGLSVPSHDEKDEDHENFAKPKIQNLDINLVSHREVPVPKGGIAVVAIRKGFYNLIRYDEGESFHVRSVEELGEWMKCSDSGFEKIRVKLINEKKARV